MIFLMPYAAQVPSEDAAGVLIGGALIVAAIVALIVYVILPLTIIIASLGVCYGGYFAIANYAQSFSDITIKGNRR